MRELIRAGILITIIGLFSIISDSCGNCDTSNLKYKWESLNLNKLRITSVTNDRITFEQIDTISFLYDEFGIQIKMNGNTLAYQKKIRFDIIQSCNAQLFDCFKDYTTDNGIKDIQITTLADFDNLHLKDSNVSGYFKAALYNNELSTIQDYLFNENEINGSHRDISNNFSSEINLFLDSKPTLDSLFRFTIKVILEDNSVICDTTDLLKIL
jgi:hypothetical protein